MRTIKRQDFRKLLGECTWGSDAIVAQISPYFQYESWYAKPIYLLENIDDPARITHYGREEELILPLNGTSASAINGDTFKPYIKELISYLNIHAPIISIYDENNVKIAQLDTK